MRLLACLALLSSAIFAQNPVSPEDVKLITLDFFKSATELLACSVPLLPVSLPVATASATPQVQLLRNDATPSILLVRPTPPIAPPCTGTKTSPPTLPR